MITDEQKRAIEERISTISAILKSPDRLFKFTPEKIDEVLFDLHEFIAKNTDDRGGRDAKVKTDFMIRLLDLKALNESKKQSPNAATFNKIANLKKDFPQHQIDSSLDKTTKNEAKSNQNDNQELADDADKQYIASWEALGDLWVSEKIENTSVNILEVGCGENLLPAIAILKSLFKSKISVNYTGIDLKPRPIQYLAKTVKEIPDDLRDYIGKIYQGSESEKETFLDAVKTFKFACADAGNLQMMQELLPREEESKQVNKIDIVLMANPRIRTGVECGFASFRNFFKDVLPKICSPNVRLLVHSDDIRNYRTFLLFNPALQDIETHTLPHDYSYSRLSGKTPTAPTQQLTKK